ncbi:Uncharacterised protein [Mycobacteroides abscessus subsp. massiliense]|nr:Uncharacterised protein [Mycobacteroides abscessus subsp. massiliense]
MSSLVGSSSVTWVMSTAISMLSKSPRAISSRATVLTSSLLNLRPSSANSGT